MKKSMTALALVAMLLPTAAIADQSTASVHGTVNAYNVRMSSMPGKPLSDATVTVSGKNGRFTANTNSMGFYNIGSIPPGKYELSAQKLGYQSVPLRGYRYICVHGADNDRFNLNVYYGGRVPADWTNTTALNQQMMQPNGSQTSGVHTIGDC